MSKNNTTNLNKVSLLAYLINLGVSVPHYCYHNNLSIAGNCRICIVEMENLPKPIVSCAVSAGTSLFNHEIYHNSGLIKNNLRYSKICNFKYISYKSFSSLDFNRSYILKKTLIADLTLIRKRFVGSDSDSDSPNLAAKITDSTVSALVDNPLYKKK